METDDESLFTKKCYKLVGPVLDNLNIVYNSANSKLFLWNKYQIFVYSDSEFECLERILIPEFQIHHVLASNNYILCLDCNGNIHITSLKFKSSAHTSLKVMFQPRDRDIKTSIKYKEDFTLSLKYEADAYFLCLNKIATEFKLIKQVILLHDNEYWPIVQNKREKYLLISHSPNKDNLRQINKMFNIEDSNKTDKELILVSFDRVTLYSCLYSPKMLEEEITLVKLYEAPAEICSIQVRETEKLYVLIGLKMGTLIRLCLNDVPRKIEIEYLNTSLSKMLAVNDWLIYTDGTTMWKTENILSSNIRFTQLFLNNVKDFTKCGDQIIATTYSNIMYKFSLEDEKCYLTPMTNYDAAEEEYYAAEKLLNNSDGWSKLFQEIDKNKEIVRKLQKEEDYITAISLSRRQDIVSKAIDVNITVFEHYEDVNNQEYTLTQQIKDYFGNNTWQLLVNITNSGIFNTLNNILSHLFHCISIYITLSTSNKILKTSCIKIDEPLKTVKYLIPINLTDETEMKVDVKIVINMPGALNQKKNLTILYKKDITLTPENFIKSSHIVNQKSLSKYTETIENQIQKINSVLYGNVFEFTDISKSNENEWSFYVKLPNDYHKQLFDVIIRSNNKNLLQLNSEQFIKEKKEILFIIGNEKINLTIQADGFSDPLLKITSKNAKLTYSLRNWFAKMIYNEYENCKPEKDFINYSYYTTTENFKKAAKESIDSSAGFETFLDLLNHFERNILGVLPL